MSSNNALFMLSGGWDEMTVTKNNMPGYHCDPELDYAAPMVGSWLILDVTEFVEDWTDGSRSNNPFLFTTYDYTYGGFYIISREGGGNQPKLVIVYSGSAVEETSWGDIKALQ